MTDILCDLKHEGDGGDTLTKGVLEWKPTARRTEGDTLLLPEPFTVRLDGTTAPTIDVRPTPVDESWAWLVVERVPGSRGELKAFQVPDSVTPVAYSALVEVDPTSFVPVSAYPTVSAVVAAHTAQLANLPQSIVDNGDGTYSVTF